MTQSDGYIHLLCFRQNVRSPSFAKEMLTACRDACDPLESLFCVPFLQAESRIKTRSSGGRGQCWVHKGGRGAAGKERKLGCSTTVLLAHGVVCRAHGVVFVDELQTLHVLPENLCLRESRLPVTCPHLPTAFSGTSKTQCLLK